MNARLTRALKGMKTPQTLILRHISTVFGLSSVCLSKRQYKLNFRGDLAIAHKITPAVVSCVA